MNRGAKGQNRTADTAIFSRMLYRLSYLGVWWALRRCGAVEVRPAARLLSESRRATASGVCSRQSAVVVLVGRGGGPVFEYGGPVI
jgi:hypothetical protein